MLERTKNKRKNQEPLNGLNYTIITTDPPEKTRRRVEAYLSLLDYIPMNPEQTEYMRPSSWGELMRFSPKGIAVRLKVDVWVDYNNKDTIVSLELVPQYNPSLIHLTDHDWEFWQVEIEGLEAAINDDYVDIETRDIIANEASVQGLLFSLGSLVMLVLPVLLLMLLMVIAVLLS